VIAHVLSYDGENEPDILALVAASAALTLSGVPFMGPVGAARVGYQNGEYQLNPSMEVIKQGDLDLVVAGTRDAVLMVESEAKELSEEVLLGAVMFAHRESQKVVNAIIDLAEQAAKDPWEMPHLDDGDKLKNMVKELVGSGLTEAYKLTGKADRVAAIAAAKAPIKDAFTTAMPRRASRLARSARRSRRRSSAPRS
jgi:polyribonucleotide nucleotidyltransferase